MQSTEGETLAERSYSPYAKIIDNDFISNRFQNVEFLTKPPKDRSLTGILTRIDV
jgi:hypothetical protein